MYGLEDQSYRVEKMKFGKNGSVVDKSIVIYNHTRCGLSA
jgi:hypothetical protein